MFGGPFHGCGVTEEERALCWGPRHDDGQTAVPEGASFSSVGAGGYHSCGVDRDSKRARCWGRSDHGELDVPPTRVAVVSAGQWHACAIDLEGHPVCWGWDRYGQASGVPASERRRLRGRAVK